MINKELKIDLQKFLNLHLNTQLRCLQLAKELNKNGFLGFAWFYQIQAMDEFLHQRRRIINYLQGTIGAEDCEISNSQFEKFSIQNPQQVVTYYIQMRQETLNFALKLKQNPLEKHDYLTATFYDWFIKDYWAEIDEKSDILDRINMSKDNLGILDHKKMGKRHEIDPEKVINPMREFIG